MTGILKKCRRPYAPVRGYLVKGVPQVPFWSIKPRQLRDLLRAVIEKEPQFRSEQEVDGAILDRIVLGDLVTEVKG